MSESLQYFLLNFLSILYVDSTRFIRRVKLILRRMEKSPINQTPTQTSENPH